MPTLRSSIGTCVTSSPLNSTRPPGSGLSSPAMMRRVVVLPQPEGPRKTTVSPSSISRLSGDRARVPSAKVFAHSTRETEVPEIIERSAIRTHACLRPAEVDASAERPDAPARGSSSATALRGARGWPQSCRAIRSGISMTRNTNVYALPISRRMDA